MLVPPDELLLDVGGFVEAVGTELIDLVVGVGKVDSSKVADVGNERVVLAGVVP